MVVGVLGGLVVGMSSVGSGSLMIVVLLVLYPRLSAKEVVGTDLVQGDPLVGSAALGHVPVGDFQLRAHLVAAHRGASRRLPRGPGCRRRRPTG